MPSALVVRPLAHQRTRKIACCAGGPAHIATWHVCWRVGNVTRETSLACARRATREVWTALVVRWSTDQRSTSALGHFVRNVQNAALHLSCLYICLYVFRSHQVSSPSSSYLGYFSRREKFPRTHL